MATTFINSEFSMYTDFGQGPYSFTSRILSDIGSPSVPAWNVRYRLDIVSNVAVNKLIDVNGNITNNSYSYTTTTNPLNVVFARKITSPGRQTTFIQVYTEGSPVSDGTANYDYVVLQAAVPITQQRDPTTNSVIGPLSNNSSINASINTTYRLDKSLNRGDDVSSVWTIQKYNPNSGQTPAIAVANVDYQLMNGTSLTSDILDIQFLSNTLNYIIQNVATGYTFSNNPYNNYANQSIPNSNAITHNFIVAVPTVNYQVLFPKLDVGISVPSNVEVSTNPITTYQNQPITITPIVQGSTGYYKQILSGGSVVIINKTDDEWLTEINNNCNVVLNISEKSTGNIIQTQTGIGPFTIILANVNSYNLQFVTTLK